MIRSMTGFATHTMEFTNIDGQKAHLTFNIKSLNSRFFEAMTKLPHALQTCEVDAINHLKKKLMRGKVHLSIFSSDPNIFKGPIEPSTTTLKSYLDAIATIQKNFNIEGSLHISDIITLPNVLVSEDRELPTDMKNMIEHELARAIKKLIEVQEKEGAALQTDLIERTHVVASSMHDVESRFKEVMKDLEASTHTALEALNHEQSELAEIKRNQLLNELERADIHEEIVRFKSHLTNLIELLTSRTIEKGRVMEFTLQELSREINTIAAKCSDFAMSSLAIGIKVELEKIREQAQNIV